MTASIGNGGLHPRKLQLIALNVVGGLAVLASYAHGLSQPDVAAFWGGVPEALRLAQVGFIRGKHKSETAQAFTTGPDFRRDPRAIYAHPYYWAPFILMGDWL